MSQPKHGVTAWVREGKLPRVRGKRKIKEFITRFEEDLIEELGGLKLITPQQHIILQATVRAYGVLLLSELYVSKAGVFRPDMAKEGVLELQPVLSKSFIAFMNSIRLNLVTLFPDGLSRKVEAAISLKDILEEKQSAKDDKQDS